MKGKNMKGKNMKGRNMKGKNMKAGGSGQEGRKWQAGCRFLNSESQKQVRSSTLLVVRGDSL